MLKRILFDLIILIAIFILPWWINIPLLFIAIFSFRNFYEFLLFSAIIFAVYSVPDGRLISNQYFYLALVSSVFILIELFKRQIIFYKK
ncbi:MAG TPA: hypothetical protein PLZ70_00600 [Candidatus Paceibacterota bacterium]|jgi:hypothetical protein|nr:hypothetical protein [Candidatus Paceibacterota bacterium]HPC12658.1 hypothetical protein [Candidatus Paceibacterota bacterium]HPI66573.1 hypothetical protein [Candidatus Paceibacterota bacterium]HQM18654.1 hypothetical protein [Candidatus Paceibacterota bacterium]HQQ21899.1 hypothetical protein [Candidatus Paceibacterota bacterium]